MMFWIHAQRRIATRPLVPAMHCWTSQHWRPIRRMAAAVVCGWVCVAAIGCESEPTFEFDELDLVAAEEELEEFPLGEYTIPIPAADQRDSRSAMRNRFQIDFDLFALVPPNKKWKVSEAWERHEGKVRDRVIRVCRNASLEVLHEPELGTLKAKLMDALGPHLGEEVRQLLITEVVTHEI
jgi:hypothetical protein